MPEIARSGATFPAVMMMEKRGESGTRFTAGTSWQKKRRRDGDTRSRWEVLIFSFATRQRRATSVQVQCRRVRGYQGSAGKARDRSHDVRRPIFFSSKWLRNEYVITFSFIRRCCQ